MSVSRFTSLSSFLNPLDVFSEDQKSVLLKATRDRAVLLLEIHEFVFQHHMSFGSETVRHIKDCLLYTSPSPRDRQKSRMPSSA